jgi:hypothetical protein
VEKWEYAIVILEWTVDRAGETAPIQGTFPAVLNHWGEQGWEAVTYTPVTFINGESVRGEPISSTMTYHVLLKRRK